MLTKSIHHNANYLAKIVRIDEFRAHPNADRLKMVSLFGNNVITGINAEPGLYCYFPLECSISASFIEYSNSFREPEKNADKTSKGYFEYHTRVRAISLRSAKSEGYIVPVASLENFCKDVLKVDFEISDRFVDSDFDTICDHQLCVKYIPKNSGTSSSSKKTRGNVKRYESKLVENQFHFHPDTSHLKREVNKISPDDYIAITNKIHGCNFVVSNVLVKRKLSLLEKVAKFFKVNVRDTEYGMLYSSRSVIKNHVMNDEKANNHFYDSDIWKIVADRIFPSLSQGISVTGEIVGYTPNGNYIQKKYDYNCAEKSLDFYVFKVTYTSACGQEFVMSHSQTVDFCKKFGFKMPETYYYGKAKHLFPELDVEDHWHEEFLQKMIDKYLEKKCHLCKNDVWAEGVILRKDTSFEWDAFKLKSFNFLKHETEMLDVGEVDMETAESVSENEAEQTT